MDKDRIKGTFEQAKGKVKETAGKLTGDMDPWLLRMMKKLG